MSRRLSAAFGLAAPLVMGAAVILLPITSMPLISRLMDHALVAPPSAVLVGLMTLVWLPLFILRGGLIPRETAPLWAFVYVALVSAGLAFFRLYPSYKGYTVGRNETSALLTLGMALAFYLVFALYYRGSRELKSFFAMLNISGCILLAWSLVQLYVVVTTRGEYDGWMVRFHDFLSLRSLTSHTFYSRLTGFAFEPSWLANMLNLLYLPFWLAATVTGFSAFPKIWRISLENLLLPVGALVLVGSFSRIGLAAFLLMLAYLAFALLLRISRRLARWLANSLHWGTSRLLNLALAALLTVAALVFFFQASLALVRKLSAYDVRAARLLDLDNYYTRDPYQLSRNFAFGERLVYWALGWRIFADYPLLGVGLGNAGFFFIEKLPFQGWDLAETIQVADEIGYLPNVKSLWSRILAETGLLGFSTLATWLFVLWRAGWFLKAQSDRLFRAAGWMGSFVIIALILEGFSVDSFALPYPWVSLGVITAASALGRAASVQNPEFALLRENA
jgi:hypothetical protein